MNPEQTELVVSCRSTRNAWDSHPRVRVTAHVGGLVCDPAKSCALVDDTGAAWGTLTVEPARIRVADREGVVRVEVTPLAGQPRDGSSLLGGTFEVRILDSDGFAVARTLTFSP